MDKTKVDDMLIEMITPKVRQIEEKFGNGEGLSQDDINTLLLKSQYNHINHLDLKLDETVDSVKALEGKFDKRFVELENKFDKRFVELENKFDKKFIELEGKFETFRADVKKDLAEFKTDIQITINNTMKWYIGGAGIILVVLKTLDIFVQ